IFFIRDFSSSCADQLLCRQPYKNGEAGSSSWIP
ncbi:hypothetical protein PF004_g30844, partial [Phytophthora fragariae]